MNALSIIIIYCLRNIGARLCRLHQGFVRPTARIKGTILYTNFHCTTCNVYPTTCNVHFTTCNVDCKACNIIFLRREQLSRLGNILFPRWE